jgi:hypothetical protein
LYLLQGGGSEDQETDAVFVPTEERIQLSVPPLSERACWSGDPEAEGHDNILAATGPAGGCPFIVLGRNAAYISGVEGVLRTFPPSACREYDLDRLTVTPFVGSQRTMRYRDIAQMEWHERIPRSFVRDLHLIAKDGSQIAIWGILDIDQMLLRIDRFDVLEV